MNNRGEILGLVLMDLDLGIHDSGTSTGTTLDSTKAKFENLVLMLDSLAPRLGSLEAKPEDPMPMLESSASELKSIEKDRV